MKKFIIEYLYEEEGQWDDMYGDYIDAENAEEAMELFLDWAREQYIQTNNYDIFDEDDFMRSCRVIEYVYSTIDCCYIPKDKM